MGIEHDEEVRALVMVLDDLSTPSNNLTFHQILDFSI